MTVNLQQAGLSCLTLEPDASGPGAAVTAGTIYLSRVSFESGGALLPASIYAACSTAGGGTATQSFMGVYNCATLNSPEIGALSPITVATRLAVTANIAAVAAGWAPQALTWLTNLGEIPPGEYWLALLTNETTTQPTIVGGTPGVLTPNFGLLTTNLRYATAGTGATALPATITTTNIVSTNAKPLCMGLSL
jgi:hypothetical protein